jgi:hypothetical protein
VSSINKTLFQDFTWFFPSEKLYFYQRNIFLSKDYKNLKDELMAN